MKYKIILITLFIVINLVWIIFIRPIYDLAFKLEVVWLLFIILGISSSIFVYRKIAKYCEPAFVMMILYLISLFSFLALDIPVYPPISHKFQIDLWDKLPFQLLLSWYVWYFSIGCFGLIFKTTIKKNPAISKKEKK